MDENTPTIQIYCAHNDVVDPASLIENPRNPNRHPQAQIVTLAKIIKHQGWRNPIVVSKRSGFVVKGHGRLKAALLLGVKEVPVDYQDYDSEAAEWADMVADNRIAELAEIDKDELASIIKDMDGSIDLELTGFDTTSLDDILSVADDSLPDDLELDAEKTISSRQPHLSYGSKKFYMQADEVERFNNFERNFVKTNGNAIGIVMELLTNGDSKYAN